MIHTIRELAVDYAAAGAPSPNEAARLYTYLLDDIRELPFHTRPAVIVCPGGGYSGTCDREAEPVAVRFNALGCHAFVLRYHCAPHRYPVALLEAAAAVAEVRAHAQEWHVDPDKIFILGFSAGGHLAASLGTLWNAEPVARLYPDGQARPGGMILCYPVISSGKYANRGSFENLLGPDPDPALWQFLSLEERVSADTVPAFIWHTYDDGCVPVHNSLMMATALRQHDVPLEMHIYPHGDHGLALANDQTARDVPACQPWPELAAAWIKQL
ncbi:MAG: alpha/beta hydrolase [Acutalibacteraceae bacterium]|jgi:acetyl esterase/lipase